MNETFAGWAILELMGHRRLAGHVREVTLAGAGFIRLDVYEGDATEAAVTQFYPPSSVYCLTPTTEEAARKAAMPWQAPALTEPRDDKMFDCPECGAVRDACSCGCDVCGYGHGDCVCPQF